jgi:hypothetical protein
MKKVFIIILASLFASLVKAQELDHFGNIIKGKKEQVSVSIDPNEKFIIAIPDKSAADLYQMVQLAISETWVNPEEVIVGESLNKYIKINGATAHRYLQNTINHSRYTKISYNFRFKDGKFMYTIKLINI